MGSVKKEPRPLIDLPREVGRKDDRGKAPWHLMHWPALTFVLNVLDYGAQKYGENDNWQRVPNLRDRYFSAAMRHMLAWFYGERRDPESGLPHLAHAIVSLLFLITYEEE